MSRLRTCVAFALATFCLAHLVRGEDRNDWPRWPVEVETAGGSRMAGTLQLKSLRVECDLGILEINADKLKSVDISKDNDARISGAGATFEGSVVTTSGSTIKGTLTIPELTMETDLGKLTLVPRKVKSITFKGSAVTKADEPKPGPLELKPDPKAESSRPVPIPRYLTHPSALRVTRIGVVRRPALSCSLGPINPPAQVPTRSGPMKRRVIEP